LATEVVTTALLLLIDTDAIGTVHVAISLRYAGVAFVLASIAAGGWHVREPLLRGGANLWIVSDPTSRADAIVVLGGGLQTRPAAAADLWRKGLADKILVSQTPDDQTEHNCQMLLNLGVPAGVIQTFGTANANTRDEAVALREWSRRNAASVLIIPTEIFPARRVRWIFRREFFGKAVRIEVPSVEAPGYTRQDWWKSEQGPIDFKSEFFKYIYYRLKY
jgi:uncharacterized SAM-binding protein YcdF (DUF218 family)